MTLSQRVRESKYWSWRMKVERDYRTKKAKGKGRQAREGRRGQRREGKGSGDE